METKVGVPHSEDGGGLQAASRRFSPETSRRNVALSAPGF